MATVIHCADRHEMEGHLRSLSQCWGRPDEREAHRAAVVRYTRAIRVLLGGAS